MRFKKKNLLSSFFVYNRGLQTSFYKRSEGKCFQLWGPYGLCCNFSAIVVRKQPQAIGKQMGMTVFQ